MEYSNRVAERLLFPSLNDVVRTNPELHETQTKGDRVKETSYSVSKSDIIGVLPTPKGMYRLSNLDQIVPYLIEVIIAFNKPSFDVDVGAILKGSLGKLVLEEYYPLAGRLKLGSDGRMVVDCGGGEGGVPFVEAFSDEEMAAAVGDITVIDQKLVRKLVYSNHAPYETILDVPPLAIQVTRFKCGGMILGMRYNHVMMDGQGFADFMRSWAEVARGIPLSVRPYLDRSILCPRNPPKTHFRHPEFSKIERSLTPLLIPNHIIATKSFCFTPATLSRLKKLVTHNDDNNSNNELVTRAPTTFELISALSWICWTRAKKLGPEETTQLVIAADGRHKLSPHMPEGYFGNGIVWACAQSKASEITKKPLSYAVGIVQEAIKAVTEDHVRSTIDFHEMTRKPLELDNTVWITKWSRLPMYELDFGLGGPSQVAPGAVLENLVVLISQGKGSKNMVITITLHVDAMEIFEELIQSQFDDD